MEDWPCSRRNYEACFFRVSSTSPGTQIGSFDTFWTFGVAELNRKERFLRNIDYLLMMHDFEQSSLLSCLRYSVIIFNNDLQSMHYFLHKKQSLAFSVGTQHAIRAMHRLIQWLLKADFTYMHRLSIYSPLSILCDPALSIRKLSSCLFILA